jgi:hypothetical protein
MVDLKKMVIAWCHNKSAYVGVDGEDALELARQVAEAVITEAIRRAIFLETPLQNQRYLSPIELIDLKREICDNPSKEAKA